MGLSDGTGARGAPSASITVNDMTMTQDLERHTGIVKFFNEAKGYGFIVPDTGGDDVFVHVSAVQRSGLNILDNGLRVSFATEPDKRGKGPKAIDLKVEA